MGGLVRVVAVGSIVLQGCAAFPVWRQSVVVPGRFSELRGRQGLVIGAPQGGSDEAAARIGAELARRTGFGLVAATGPADPDGGYESRVREVSGGPLRLYVEIIGGSRGEEAGRIEMAAVGVSGADVWRLGTLFEMIRDAQLAGHSEKLRLDVRVVRTDPVRLAASGGEGAGIYRLSERAIRIELPRAVRAEGREVYTRILAEFLNESSRLLLPKAR